MEKKKSDVALSSVYAGVFLTTMKFVVGLSTGSIGIISEAVHSSLDLVTALITFLSIKISGKPADSSHNYGHGKVESLSALVGTVLLFATSAWIVYEAYNRLISGKNEIEITWYSFAIIIISIGIDISRSRALYRIAKETKSQALEADALHFASDIYSSGVVLVGLACAYLGFHAADSYAAIVVSLVVLKAGFTLAKSTIEVLMDAAPHGTVEKITSIVNTVDGIFSLDKVRARPSGPNMYVDLKIEVSRKNSSDQVDEIQNQIEKKLKTEFGENTDITINFKTIALNNESIIERIQIVANNNDVYVHDIDIHQLGVKKEVSFHLEVSEKLSLEQAHEIATKMEKILTKDLGDDFDIVIHIEPYEEHIEKGTQLNVSKILDLGNNLKQISHKYPEIVEVHDIKGYKSKNKLFLTVHMVFDKKVALKDAHQISDDIERKIKNKFSKIEKFTIHVEV